MHNVNSIDGDAISFFSEIERISFTIYKILKECSWGTHSHIEKHDIVGMKLLHYFILFYLFINFIIIIIIIAIWVHR